MPDRKSMVFVPLFQAGRKNRGQHHGEFEETCDWVAEEELLAPVQPAEPGGRQIGEDSQQDTSQGVRVDQVVPGVFSLDRGCDPR